MAVRLGCVPWHRQRLGTYSLHTAEGGWQGPCRGASARSRMTRTCWLTGSDAYAGLTYYLVVTETAQGSGAVEGVIYPGSPAEP